MPQGHLFGGRVTSLAGVEAQLIGSASGSPTAISGISPAQAEALLQEIQTKLQGLDTFIAETLKALGPFSESCERLPGLESLACRRINELLLKLVTAKAEKENLERRRERLQQAAQSGFKFWVSYKQKLHKGTVIKVGEDTFAVDSDQNGPAAIEYNHEARKFKVGTYRAMVESSEAKAKST